MKESHACLLRSSPFSKTACAPAVTLVWFLTSECPVLTSVPCLLHPHVWVLVIATRSRGSERSLGSLIPVSGICWERNLLFPFYPKISVCLLAIAASWFCLALLLLLLFWGNNVVQQDFIVRHYDTERLFSLVVVAAVSWNSVCPR